MSKYLNETFNEPLAENVKFSAKWRGYNNETCQFCNGITSIVIIKYPVSHRWGKKLEFGTKYKEKWICGECLEKLKNAIESVGDKNEYF